MLDGTDDEILGFEWLMRAGGGVRASDLTSVLSTPVKTMLSLRRFHLSLTTTMLEFFPLFVISSSDTILGQKLLLHILTHCVPFISSLFLLDDKKSWNQKNERKLEIEWFYAD